MSSYFFMRYPDGSFPLRDFNAKGGLAEAIVISALLLTMGAALLFGCPDVAWSAETELADDAGVSTLVAAAVPDDGDYSDFISDLRIQSSRIPSTGNVSAVCLLVEFSDCAHEAGLTADAVQEELYSGVHDFYISSSYGLLNIDVRVAGDWITAEHHRGYYEELAEERGYGYALAVLLQEAVGALDEEVDFSEFDATGDGYVDEVYLVCAGGRGPFAGFWWPSSEWCGYDVEADGVKVGSFELLTGFSLGDGGRTAAHETGHSLGLRDLYRHGLAGAESFSVSDLMNDNEGDLNAFSKIQLGWITPRVVSSDCEITLKPSSTSADAVIVLPHGQENPKGFFVLEYLTPDKRGVVCSGDTASGGLRIWRVNGYGDNRGDGAPFIENVDWQNYRGMVMRDLGQDYSTAMWAPGSIMTPYAYPSSFLYKGASVSDGVEYSGVSIETASANGRELTCRVGYEGAPQERPFEYTVSYEVGNKLYGVFSFPVETYIVGEEISLTTEGGTVVPLNYEMDFSVEHQAYTKLIVNADLAQCGSSSLKLTIGRGTLKTAYGLANPDISVDIANDTSVASTTTGRNSTILGISNVVSFNGALYTFKVIDGVLTLLRVSEGYETIESRPLFASPEGNVFLRAAARGDSYITLLVSAGETLSVYKVTPDGDYGLVTSINSGVEPVLEFCDGKLVAWRMSNSATLTYDICLVDVGSGATEAVIEGFCSVFCELTVSDNHLAVWQDRTVSIYNSDGELMRVLDLAQLPEFAPNEQLDDVVELNGQLALITTVVDSVNGGRVYCTMLDGSYSALEKRVLYDDSHYLQAARLYAHRSGYMLALSIADGYASNNGAAWNSSRATAVFYNENLEYEFSRMFALPGVGDEIKGLVQVGDGSCIVYTDFESMHVVGDLSRRSLAGCEFVQRPEGPYVHTGEAIEPAVVVRDGGAPLRLGVDYLVSFLNNVEVGNATMRVVGIGAYCGTVSFDFSITHDLSKTDGVPATCTEPGFREYWTCSICGKYFLDAEGCQEVDEGGWTLEPAGHDLEEHAAKDPTCEAPGNYAYWSCSACGCFFSDGDGRMRIEEGSWIIPAIPSCVVVVAASPAEGGTVAGGGSYAEGSYVVVTATPNPGFRFVAWIEDDMPVSFDPTYSFVLTAQRDLVAVFKPMVYDVVVAASPEEGGVVAGGGSYEYGETVVIEAVPNPGYRFVAWIESDAPVSFDPVHSFVPEANRRFVAIFEAEPPALATYTVAFDSAGGSAVAPQAVEEGQRASRPADPVRDDYVFRGWTLDGAAYDFAAPVTADIVLVAAWEAVVPAPAVYSVSVAASPAEGGSVSGGGEYEEGDFANVVAVANDGYRFLEWVEGNSRVSTSAIYGFEVSADRELAAVFEVVVPKPGPAPDPDPEPALPYSDLWNGFPDVKWEVQQAGGPEKVWYVADGWLDYVVDAGLMSGYSSNGWFGPYDNITRGQVAVILFRAECAKDPRLLNLYGSTTDPFLYAVIPEFRDMEAGVYYTAAVNWAKAVGIMTGDAATNYTTVRPNDPVARQELCLMLARYANGGTVPSVELDPARAEGIKGMDQIADWARDGVYWAVNNGVIGGVNNGDGTFSMDPTGKTWRSAAAKMFTVVMRDVL